MPKIEKPEIKFENGIYYAMSPRMYICGHTKEDVESRVRRALVLFEEHNKENQNV